MQGSWTDALTRYADIGLAVLVVAIVGMMIIPLPSFLLDILLTCNISISLTLVLITIYMPSALNLSVFPSLLLATTLFRLALNVSSTRLILLHGEAGEVILSFGQFVVSGNLVVGAIIFLILMLINFLVIAKGSERVSEVAARFTLDAMPGKQMSIDADMRAGAIDMDEGRTRRRALERESQLFGAMDGAMKFVKGDPKVRHVDHRRRPRVVDPLAADLCLCGDHGHPGPARRRRFQSRRRHRRPTAEQLPSLLHY